MTERKELRFETIEAAKKAEQEGAIFHNMEDCDLFLIVDDEIVSFWRWYALIRATDNLIQLPKSIRLNSRISSKDNGIWVHGIEENIIWE